jgi:hypothetical protein
VVAVGPGSTVCGFSASAGATLSIAAAARAAAG